MDIFSNYRTERNLFTFWSIIFILLFVIYQQVLFFSPYIFDNICILIQLFKILCKKIMFLFKFFKKINFFYQICQYLKRLLRVTFLLPLRLLVLRERVYSICNFFIKFFRILLRPSKKTPKKITEANAYQLTNKIQSYLNKDETVDERELIQNKKQKFHWTNISEGFFLYNENLYEEPLIIKSKKEKIRL